MFMTSITIVDLMSTIWISIWYTPIHCCCIEKIEELDKTFSDAGFEVLKKELISKEVVTAMEAFHEFKLAFFQNMVQGWLRKPLNDFAGVKGSNIHKEFSNGKMVYYHYVLRKG